MLDGLKGLAQTIGVEYTDYLGMRFNAMDPRLLIPLIAWVSMIPEPLPHEALDFVPRLYHAIPLVQAWFDSLCYFEDRCNILSKAYLTDKPWIPG